MERTVILVSHTHWDREWYRPFEEFRARLVDTVDRVLDQLLEDPGWSFLLDGQTVVIEDYLAVRPGRRADLERVCREGRLAIGPWYVQPDSLLPAGETHVRNLLEGRRVGRSIGEVSRVGYTPDSFGHPAQMPQLLAGFGLGSFVYWRGNGNELRQLGSTWTWAAPDGSEAMACLMAEGYFPAAYLGEDVNAAAERLRVLTEKLTTDSDCPVLLMNGMDHAPPDPDTGPVAERLAATTGWDVRRGLLEEYVALTRPTGRYTGDLRGGLITNLLPGVWSTRTYLKLRNRACESALVDWAEPFVAIGQAFGLPDERPALRSAWRSLLVNQAHDSICGCSVDPVHEQMLSRYDTTQSLASETTGRVLEHLSGLGPTRRVRWDGGIDIAVWNPSSHQRTDLVRFPLDGHPPFMIGNPGEEIHTLVMSSFVDKGFQIDGQPARIVVADDPSRLRMLPDQEPWDVEWVATDVPAFGWRRFRLTSGPPAPDECDAGRTIEAEGLTLEVGSDGTLTLGADGHTWSGLLGLEDVGDRGDSYDFDPVGASDARVDHVEVTRRRHVNGVQELDVRRIVSVPSSLTAKRDGRSDERTELVLDVLARLVPGTGRADIEVTLENTAKDHRLRLLFPTGAERCLAATTFDVASRPAGTVEDAGWVQPAVPTFPQQGWVSAGNLTIGAPGLPEAELTDDGTVAITLVRSVGWLSQMDLHTRPLPAGPGLPAPGAQCLRTIRARLALFPDGRAAARDGEVGFRAVAAGPEPMIEPARPLIELAPSRLMLSAVKPAEDGPDIVVRVLNPSDELVDAELRVGLPVTSARMVRLDETPTEEPVELAPNLHGDGAAIAFSVPPHALRSVRLGL